MQLCVEGPTFAFKLEFLLAKQPPKSKLKKTKTFARQFYKAPSLEYHVLFERPLMT